MALKSGLSLYCYTPASSTPGLTFYADVIDSLEFTTISPGGFGTLTAKIKLADARQPHPELAIFSRIAVMDPSVIDTSGCVWIGEIHDPELGMNPQDGEYVRISALGLGNSLRDDPRNVTYNNTTAPAIVKAEMSSRSAYLAIDADTSQVFPDNPAATFSPAYTGRSMEEVVADVAILAGDYSWGTWAHPHNRDNANMPTGQLVMHLRDTTTIAYSAYLATSDITAWRIIPTSERAYNAVAIGYNDPSQAAPVGTALYKDSRLAANLSQGTAPFRYRKFLRDLAGIATVTKAQAQNIANTYGAEYQNVTNKIELTLASARDANGNRINIWQVQADHNISTPELYIRGTTLPTSPAAGTNLFYIVETRYMEDAAGGAKLILQCDNWVDWAAVELGRLQQQADALARRGLVTTGATQALGAPAQGVGGGISNPTVGGVTVAFTVDYGATLSQTTTSVTLAPTINVNTNAVAATNPSVLGFLLSWTAPSGASNTQWYGTWTTVGNCLLDVDEVAGTFVHHCDGCEARHRAVHGCTEGCAHCREQATRRALSLHQHLRIHTDRHPERGSEPGFSALCVDCAACLPPGIERTESFNTGLGAEHEDTALFSAHHARQAHLIRRIMAFHGLPMLG